jgi:hypothetical protein
MRNLPLRLLILSIAWALPLLQADTPPTPKTTLTIEGEKFFINGQPTYAGRIWKGKKIEGLLMNARVVQGLFDDRNPNTTARWAYPDTGRWDAERNHREFLAAMPVWRAHGLLALTTNFQGGNPDGYSPQQPWINDAYHPDGSLRPEYAERMARIINFADDLGMVVILGYFYFGQDHHLADEAAVLRATDEVTRWILRNGWRNVLVEVNNETSAGYDHAILKPARVHELIERVKQTTAEDGRRLLVTTSYPGNTVPGESVIRSSDFLLLHGNGVHNPARVAELVKLTRKAAGYRPMPIVFNEDDHFNFDVPTNNFSAAIDEYTSWGYFDYRMPGESFDEGYQSVPVNWGISSPRKAAFFRLLSQITGEAPGAK